MSRLSNNELETRKFFAEQGFYPCSKCKEYLTKEFFYKKAANKFGVDTTCKLCRSKYHYGTGKAKSPDKIFLTIKKEQQAKKGLYYCSICKKFLAVQHFSRDKSRIFGLSYFCKKCNPFRVRDLKSSALISVDKQEEQAKKGLYYCNTCKKYLPRQFFVFNRLGKFQLRPECKLCHNPPENYRNMICKIKISENIEDDIKFLSLYNDKSILSTVLELIAKGLNSERNKQKRK